MPRVTKELTLEEIREIVLQLPANELLALNEMIGERAETLAIMQLANTGFQEWAEEGEDIYDARA